MPASLIIVVSKVDISRHSLVPSLSFPSRTASWNCWYVQEPIPAVTELVMFGPCAPAALSAWQLAHSLVFQTWAPRLIGSSAGGGSSVLPQAGSRAASAAANRYIVAKRGRVLKTK